MKNLPEGYNDAVHVDTDIYLSFLDKWKVILGWKFIVKSVVYCENKPGKTKGESEIVIYRIPWFRKMGYTATSEERKE